ncbi:MAG TPA: hypothetical protein VGJ06_22390, partial [Candidatus Acidoferrum sp.]
GEGGVCGGEGGDLDGAVKRWVLKNGNWKTKIRCATVDVRAMFASEILHFAQDDGCLVVIDW